MPAKILPGELDLERLSRELRRRGFRSVTGVEFHNDFRRFELKAPRPRPGRETGFVFTANGLSVRVWTTWLPRENKAREVDSAWVLITDGDRPLYFSRPIHRTKNFTVNLLRAAWIARWRILYRPICPECKRFMDICRGRGLKSRYWGCKRAALHKSGGAIRLNWDYVLPPKARRCVESLRRESERYRRERRASGKPIGAALLTRKPWKWQAN